jgi:hypothetical protein
VIVIDVARAAVMAARAASSLTPCREIFAGVPTAQCLEPGELGRQQVRPSG